MRILLQRVTSASVVVEGETVGEIGSGLLLLTGFGKTDDNNVDEPIGRACEKLVNLRVFENDAGKLDRSILDHGGDILAVPQFTLYGKATKGRRPDFTDAMAPDKASPAFDRFVSKLSARLDKPVAKGVFGAEMAVSLVNDGPLTLQLEF